ncbi:hypothetical protein EI314_24610 [Salmonella enterica]|nr:hypothetical protein [Salmonella enterica]
MKKQVQLINGNFMRLHYKPQKKIIEKATKVANDFVSGAVRPRKLSNGLFQVLDISRTERIVIDKEKQIHLMSHEKYNDFVNQR